MMMLEQQEQEKKDLMGLLELTLGGEVRSVPKRSIWGLERFRSEAARAFGPIPGMLMKMRQSLPPGLSDQERARLPEDVLAQLEEKNAQARLVAFADVLPDLMPHLMGRAVTVVMELPFLYAAELEMLRGMASEEELFDAGVEVLAEAFPLLGKVMEAMARLTPTETTM